MKNEILEFISDNIPELKNYLCPVFTSEMDRLSVKYTITPVSGGHLKQSQLELVIIDSDYDKCQEIEREICGLLDMEEDHGFIKLKNVLVHSQLSGGGILYNDGCQKYEDTLYFILDWSEI